LIAKLKEIYNCLPVLHYGSTLKIYTLNKNNTSLSSLQPSPTKWHSYTQVTVTSWWKPTKKIQTDISPSSLAEEC